jgi:hypothetical protein
MCDLQELGELMNSPLEGISINPDENNLQHWDVTMLGPVRLLYTHEHRIDGLNRLEHHSQMANSSSLRISPSSFLLNHLWSVVSAVYRL